MKTKPSAGALRAAERTQLCSGGINEYAEIIEEETGLKDLVEAVEWIREALGPPQGKPDPAPSEEVLALMMESLDFALARAKGRTCIRTPNQGSQMGQKMKHNISILIKELTDIHKQMVEENFNDAGYHPPSAFVGVLKAREALKKIKWRKD